MLLLEPWLVNPDPDGIARPWVKWSYQPVRPQDVPAAFMRAYAIALQPPQGPVFLSLPLDDWDAESTVSTAVRSVATRVGPDPERLAGFAALPPPRRTRRSSTEQTSPAATAGQRLSPWPSWSVGRCGRPHQ